MRSRRDSWPPTLVHLEPYRLTKDGEPRPLLDIDDDDDPLTYFLTPAPPYEDQEGDTDMMDFDAGIEDPSQPRTIVRSVSPSTLDGLRKPPSKARSPSPDFDSDMASPDEDDEDYIRFSPNTKRFPSLRDLYIDGLGQRPEENPIFGGFSTNALLSPASFAPPPSRSRAQPLIRVGRARSTSVRSRPSHLWREPSPDVWSIEEEPEEELENATRNMDKKNGSDVEQKAAKPKKRVRFVLPDAE